MIAISEDAHDSNTPETSDVISTLSFWGKLTNLFFDPRKCFGSVGRTHEWIILWLLVSSISIIGFQPIKEIVRTSQMAEVNKQLDKSIVTDTQRAKILQSVNERFDNPLMMLLVPVSQLFVLLFVSAVLLFVGNVILGGTLSYLRILNCYAWTAMIVIPESLVTVPLVLAKGSTDVSIGLSVLTSSETGPFLKSFLTSFEFFGLWQVWLTSVALAVMTGVRTVRAIPVVMGAWLVWVLVKSGMSSLGLSFGG